MTQEEKSNYLLTKIKEYSELKDNWDGYEGTAPSSDIIETAEKFVEILKTLPLASTMVSSEEIGFFWKKDKLYVEICIFKKNEISYFWKKEENFSGEDNISIDSIPDDLIKKIYETEK